MGIFGKKKSIGSGDEWERDVLERLAFAALSEQRRTRRWNLVFRFAFLGYLLLLLFLYAVPDGLTPSVGKDHIAMVRVEGVIAANQPANANSINQGLRSAFDAEGAQAVVIEINSPGGSPVQAGRVNQEIRRLRELHPEIPVYAVVDDICASGGYYIAAAADQIFADRASLVGSIGVLFNGFGFVGAMERVGVERRLLTAGEHKGFLDPFSPLDQTDRTHVQGMLDGIHQQFIEVVESGRGERLSKNADLFSGLAWNGEESLELGLIDGFGDTRSLAREKFGLEEVVDYTSRPHPLDRLLDRIGGASTRAMMQFNGLR
ncbi:MAG: S49 family peptidase [Gammaproteobacteria bacterium]|nr:S49 family peptidase [Gammaproteobacteria bacterium]